MNQCFSAFESPFNLFYLQLTRLLATIYGRFPVEGQPPSRGELPTEPSALVSSQPLPALQNSLRLASAPTEEQIINRALGCDCTSGQ